jgi:hypothetical protein
MKNKVNFLRQSFRLCMIIAIVSLIAFQMVSCGDGSSSGSGGKGTLVVQNVSTFADEIITELYTTNHDTGINKRESVGTGISVREERSFSLDEGQYTVRVETNFDDGDDIEFFLRSGSIITIKWNGNRLSR